MAVCGRRAQELTCPDLAAGLRPGSDPGQVPKLEPGNRLIAVGAWSWCVRLRGPCSFPRVPFCQLPSAAKRRPAGSPGRVCGTLVDDPPRTIRLPLSCVLAQRNRHRTFWRSLRAHSLRRERRLTGCAGRSSYMRKKVDRFFDRAQNVFYTSSRPDCWTRLSAVSLTITHDSTASGQPTPDSTLRNVSPV